MPADKMTDAEIVQKCAVAMGWKHLGAVGIDPPKRGEPEPKGLWCLSGGNDWWLDLEGNPVCGTCESIPDPLNDKAQAMELVIKFEIAITPRDILKNKMLWTACYSSSAWHEDTDLLRAICECVANIKGKT